MLLDTARSPWAPDQAVRVARVVTWAAACAASGHMRAPGAGARRLRPCLSFASRVVSRESVNVSSLIRLAQEWPPERVSRGESLAPRAGGPAGPAGPGARARGDRHTRAAIARASELAVP